MEAGFLAAPSRRILRMRLLIIDGGGTSTDVAICDQHHVVSRSILPSVKPTPADLKTDDLCRMLGTFLATSPIDDSSESPVAAVILGMAGVWSPRERYSYAQSMTESWMTYVSPNPIQLVILSDVELALVAAHGFAPGAVLIGGTGSIMLLRDSQHQLVRSGGWGPQIDDAGSGYWLGRTACAAVARMLDGRGPSTLLMRPVAAYLRVDEADHEAVRTALRTTTAPAFAKIGAAVLSYADELDAVAIDIRDEGARELALLLSRVPHDVPVSIYGSLFQNATYKALVERYASRPLVHVEDVITAVASQVDRAGNLRFE